MCSVLPGEPVRGTGFCAPRVVSISDKANSFPGYSDAKYSKVLWTDADLNKCARTCHHSQTKVTQVRWP